MTPTNPLDDKVIVDRDLFRTLCVLAGRASETPTVMGRLNDEDARTCTHLWNQDNTGWAAAPVLSTIQMDCAGANNVFDNLSRASETWIAMLAACPPLGGGE